jgi:predicted glycosyltransferase
MRIWIDVLTPKQANLFSVLARRFREQGHEVFLTTRNYREVQQLLRIRGIPATVVGRHGAGDLLAKLVESSKRITELATIVAKETPDLAVSFCSPEAARTSFGLGVPHYAICDSPHAEAVCRLSLPLSKKLFAPKVIPKSAWRKYPVALSDIIQYDAIDPAVWIRAYTDHPDITGKLGLDPIKPTVVMRTEEEYASYLLPHAARERSLVTRLAYLLSTLGVQIVVLPRYEKQVQVLTTELRGLAVLPAEVVDGIGLLSHTSVFIGAGGTMTAEAALMGVPTISCYPSEPTYVDRYLLRKGLVERILSPERIVSRVRRFLSDPKLTNRQKKKADLLLGKMEDPVRIIMTHLGLLRKR